MIILYVNICQAKEGEQIIITYTTFIVSNVDLSKRNFSDTFFNIDLVIGKDVSNRPLSISNHMAIIFKTLALSAFSLAQAIIKSANYKVVNNKKINIK